MAMQIQPRSVDIDADDEKYDSIMVVYRDSQSARSNGTIPTRKTSRETMLTERTVDTERDKGGVTCKNLLTDICQATTIHGLNKVTEESPFRARRVIWSILVIIGFLLFIVQVIQSCMLYFSYPITVNVKVTYLEKMRFPAVTVCNINSFRTTETAKLDVYDILSESFNPEGRTREQDIVLSIQQLKESNSKIKLDEIYQKTAHRKEDFIISCYFKGERCRSDDWTTVMTEYGQCYTFNGAPFRNKSVRYTSQTGARGGLRLRLNIEQYEYMNGPNQGAGVRFLVHDQMDVPAIKALGTVVPPGFHGMVGVSLHEIKNLVQPYGACSAGQYLDYYDYYSVQACVQECKQKYLVSKCQCIEPYMKTEFTGDTPVCTLRQFLDCVMPAKESFESSGQYCSCPVPCLEKVYSTSTSLASLSQVDRERIVATQPELVSAMIQKYKIARETAQKYDKILLQKNRKILQELSDAVNSMEVYLNNVIKKLTGMQLEVPAVVEMVAPRLRFHRSATLSFMEYNIKHNFNRGWEVMTERVLKYVTYGYVIFLDYFKRSVDKLDRTNKYKKAIRDSLLFDVDRYVAVRKTVTEGALKSIQDALSAYVNGTLINKFQFIGGLDQITEYDRTFTPLCVRTMTASDMYSFKVINESLVNFTTTLNRMQSVARVTHGGTTGVNSSEIDYLSRQFTELAGIYNYRLFQIKDKVVDLPLNIVEKKLDDFQALNTSLYDAASKIMVYITSSKDSLESFLSNTFSRVKNMQKLVSRFSRSSEVSKTDIATDLMSEDAAAIINTLKKLLTHIQSRDRDIKDTMVSLKMAISSVYKDMLSNKCITKFYKMLRNDISQTQNNATKLSIAFGDALKGSALVKIISRLLNKPTQEIQRLSSYEVMKQTNADLAPLNLDMKLRDIDNTFMFMERKYGLAPTKYNDTVLFQTFTRAREQFQSFVDRSKIDGDFMSDNLLHLDVFAKELSYESISQGQGYGLTMLWSDLGGSLALFLGASVLTVVELIDILIHNAYKNRRPRRPKLRRDDTSREFYL